jgi:hypothetical protein
MPLDPDTIDGDEEIETTFRRLRREGHSRPEAVQALLNALDVSLAEAKRLLLSHDTWGEVRASAYSPPDSSSPSATDTPATPPPAPG